MLREEAKRRQGARTDLHPTSAPIGAEVGKAGEPPAVRADLPAPDAGRARDHAASMLNVSPRSVENAAKVIAHAAPELVAAVERGAPTPSLRPRGSARRTRAS